MTRFFYVQIPCWKAPSWMEDGGSVWNNFAGGRTPKSDGDKIHKIEEAEEIDDLDWGDSYLVEKTTHCGWLSPKGEWHGCSSQNHDTYAWLILHLRVKTLERMGWIRVWSQRKDDWTCDKIPTEEQRSWLVSQGFEFNLDEWGRL